MKLAALILCPLCLAPITRHGAETLTLLARQGQRQKMLQSASQAAQAIPTNAPMLRAIIKTNPPFVPPRTSTLEWLTPTYRVGTNEYLWLMIDAVDQTNGHHPWLTWLERSTNLQVKGWQRITPAVTPQKTNSATITNVWPQFIRSVEGWKP